tara:strand:- start:50 stop:586 length:537 start_codon:yes stop_codon:yes gene_type:complete
MNWYTRIIRVAATMRLDNEYTRGKTITYEVNPTLDQIIHLASLDRYNSVRMLATPNGWYAWPSSQSTHTPVMAEVGIDPKEAIGASVDDVEVQVQGNKLLIFQAPDAYSGQTPLPWQGIRPIEDGGDIWGDIWTHEIDISGGSFSPDPYGIDVQREQAQESFEKLDKPSSPTYKRWGD